MGVNSPPRYPTWAGEGEPQSFGRGQIVGRLQREIEDMARYLMGLSLPGQAVEPEIGSSRGDRLEIPGGVKELIVEVALLEEQIDLGVG